MDCLPQLHLAAYHAQAGHNNDTHGVGTICQREEHQAWIFGTYFNSVRAQSVYAGAVWQPWSLGSARLGAFAGAVTGYRNTAIPMLGGVLSVPLGRSRWHLALLPEVPDRSSAALALSISWGY